MNTLPALAAQEAVRDHAYIENYVTEALAARELLCVGLEKLGIAYVPSQANFVLMHVGKRAIEIRDALRAQGMLVRDRSYEIARCRARHRGHARADAPLSGPLLEIR